MHVHQRFLSTVLAALALASLTACSGGGGGDSTPVAPSVTPILVPPTITTDALGQAEVNQVYTATLSATGTGPLTWQRISGFLPTGVTVQASGTVTGTPTQEGQFLFTVRVTGPGGMISKDLTLVTLGSTHRVSVVSNTLGEANGPSGAHARSFDPGISHTGRFVVFDSAASNLVPGLTPTKRQVYLHDRETGLTEMVSVTAAGTPGNDESFVATVSDDGNTVVFDSFASNLVGNDTGGARDVFLRDRVAGTTQRLSQYLNGNQGVCAALPVNPMDCNSSDPSISADGSIVAFGTWSQLTPDDTDEAHDVYVFNRTASSLQRISVGIGGPPNGLSGSAAVSAEGRYITFSSLAHNLMVGDTVDMVSDIFVFDRQTGLLRKVTGAFGGGAADGPSFGPSISGDGRFVAFWSEAANLQSGPDGTGFADIFVADLQATPASIKKIVTLLGTDGDGESRAPSISRDGRIIAFDSLATNLDATVADGNGARDIYVLDRSCSSTFSSGPCTFTRVSVASNGDASNGESRFPALSGDGKYLAYYSDATNLVPVIGDANTFRDAFVTRRP